MTASEYQEAAARTAKQNPTELDIAVLAMGLAGEAGELVDLIKKEIGHLHPHNRAKVVKEAGDVTWYLAMLCKVYGITLEEVFVENIRKLNARYPEGWDPERSLNRSVE